MKPPSRSIGLTLGNLMNHSRTGRRVLALSLGLVLSSCAAGSPLGEAPESQLVSVPAADSTPSATPEESAAPTFTSSHESADEAPPGAIHVRLTPDLDFEPKNLKAKAGDITFFLENVSPALEHNVAFGTSLEEPPLARTPHVIMGQDIVFMLEDVPAGTYAIWCEVHEHAQYGMVGTLVVR
jgi:plastocyanin